MASLNKEKDIFNRKKGIALRDSTDYIGVPAADIDDDRAEKPWQRVWNGLRKKRVHLYEPVRSVPCSYLILLLGVYLLLGYLGQLIEDDMPTPVGELSRDNSDTFSEESAWVYFHRILGDQPRVAGTRYHYEKTSDVKAMVDEIAAQATQVVRTDWQFATGHFFLQSSAPYHNYYQNASNIVALLEGESGFTSNGTIGTSILVNCHYDSVPYALGASDNVVFCAVMAETLSKLSRRPNKPKHNIIFLFNGAEENGLQASHAFLQHPWASGVTTVLNLDAAGMNGKPAVFQVTDPRVLNAYRRTVSNPNAQGVGEFLFSSGIIPSDTDFRIWRDFGDIHGIDVAFTKWGHVYHTRYDHPDLIHRGVLQNAGNMMMALVAELGDMEALSQKASPSAAVYFDFMNTFVVTYSLNASYAVDAIIALIALATVAYYVWLVDFRRTTIIELLYSALGRLVCLIFGVAVTAVLVLIMVATTVQLRYLSEAWIVVPIFWMPYVITAVLVSEAYDAWRLRTNGYNRSVRTLQAQAATRFILAIALLLMTCVPALTTTRYLVTAPLFMMSISAFVSLTVHRYFRLTGWQHLLLEAALSLPTVLFVYSLALRLDAMMLPIMGRSTSSAPDYIVGLINVGLAILVTSTVSGIELLFSRRRIWLVAVPLSLVCVVIMFVPFSPYRDDGPSTQRHYWFHTEIVSFDVNNNPIERTAGVLVTRMDPHSTENALTSVQNAGINVDSRFIQSSDCVQHVYCNMPLFRTSMARSIEQALFLYTGGPTAFVPAPNMTLTGRQCQGTNCTYSFVMTGQNHNMLTLWPRDARVSVSGWSFEATPLPSFALGGRPVYVVYHSTATYSEGWTLEFSVDLTVPESLQSGAVMDLSHHSHKIYHPEDFTTEYRNLVEAMPRYFNIATFISFRYNYVF